MSARCAHRCSSVGGTLFMALFVVPLVVIVVGGAVTGRTSDIRRMWRNWVLLCGPNDPAPCAAPGEIAR